MRTELDHLPPQRTRELERVVRILFEEFEAARVASDPGKRGAGILKVILYGSYARGDWVDEPHTSKGYRSDFDLLVIVSQKELADRSCWEGAERRLDLELSVTKSLRTPVNFIVHTLQEVNDGLAHGRYFFMDLARDGVVLYQADASELLAPRPKTPAQALAAAAEYFDEWFPAAMKRFDLASVAIERGYDKQAAFDLHQTAEQLYHCVLLVCTFYTPHVHNLGFLRSQAERVDVRLVDAWPRGTRLERARFEKLKAAYVKARYSRHYKVDDEELAWLAARVEELGRTVHAVCSDRLGSLRSAACAAAS